MEIVLDILTIPSDNSFETKASGDIPDENSFVTSDTNTFFTSHSKNSRRSRQSRLSEAIEGYLF